MDDLKTDAHRLPPTCADSGLRRPSLPAPSQRPDTGTNREPSFLFACDGTALLAHGVQQRITLPVGSNDDAHGPFRQAVAGALAAAREAGQDNPMVVGALPFAPGADACLFVPQHWSRQPLPAAQPAFNPTRQLTSQTTTPNADLFKQAVRDTVAHINTGALQKAVLAACQQLTFDGAISAAEISRNLRAQDGHGYHFCLPLPDGSTLVGASPELLVQKQGDQLLLLPLAGSAPRQADPEADRRNAAALQQSAKDQHEHAFVVRDIAALLAPLCNELRVPERPALLATRNVWHLATRIEGRLKDPAVSALQLACRLHPTPAICGTPTDRARDWIRQVEPFDRGLYSGVVGWCDSRGNGQWALAIRCGIVQGNSVRLYAGAGIVDASDPDAEWQEVQNKLRRMRFACGLTQ